MFWFLIGFAGGNRKVYVGNLTWTLTDEQFLEFAQRGDPAVESLEIMRHEDTNRSKGWG